MGTKKGETGVAVPRITLPTVIRDSDADFFSDLAINWAQKAEAVYEHMAARGEVLLRERVDLIKFMVTVCAEAAAKVQRAQTVAGRAPKIVNPKPEEHTLAHKSEQELEAALHDA